ncbi:hypothetical protein HZA96_06870 [Candidatus Woesearchaeota archaeon]|nr:hypothetical protein [Candidatus Woesearchaeota archaeon]
MEKPHQENKEIAVEKADISSISHSSDNEFKEVKESKDDDQPISESKQTKYLIISIIVIILIVVGIILIPKFYTPKLKTIDNLLDDAATKKNSETSFVYNGFSFVKKDGTWYTHIQNSLDLRTYTIAMHFSPKEVENITIEGNLLDFLGQLHKINNLSSLDYQSYFTFDPIGTELSYIAVASGEMHTILRDLSGIDLIASCTNDNDPACQKNTTQIITCENTKEPVIFFKEANTTAIIIKNNCLTIQGAQYGLIRATDRLLYKFYGIVE